MLVGSNRFHLSSRPLVSFAGALLQWQLSPPPILRNSLPSQKLGVHLVSFTASLLDLRTGGGPVLGTDSTVHRISREDHISSALERSPFSFVRGHFREADCETLFDLAPIIILPNWLLTRFQPQYVKKVLWVCATHLQGLFRVNSIQISPPPALKIAPAACSRLKSAF